MRTRGENANSTHYCQLGFEPGTLLLLGVGANLA